MFGEKWWWYFTTKVWATSAHESALCRPEHLRISVWYSNNWYALEYQIQLPTIDTLVTGMALLAGGLPSEASDALPPASRGWGLGPYWPVGERRKPSNSHSPASRAPSLLGSCPLCLGQNPISLVYQVHPPIIDTLVTRMSTSTTILLILIFALRDLVAQWAQWSWAQRRWWLALSESGRLLEEACVRWISSTFYNPTRNQAIRREEI